MKAGRVVQAGKGFALPGNIVQKLGGDIAFRPQVALMCAKQRPAVIIDGVDPGIRGLENRNFAFIPGCVVAEAVEGDAVGIDTGQWCGGRRGRQ
jgi:hypothetical protein